MDKLSYYNYIINNKKYLGVKLIYNMTNILKSMFNLDKIENGSIKFEVIKNNEEKTIIFKFKEGEKN